MANIEYFHDACKTAADVMARARDVREKRRSAFSKPQVIYIRKAAPEPIVKLVKSSIPEMLHSVCEHYKIQQSDLLEMIEEAHLRRKCRDIAEARNIRIRNIQEAVCSVMGVRLIDMLSGRRGNEIVMPRHIAMFLCKKYLLKSLPEIGKGFGHRDHTTVLHAIRKIDALSQTDPEIRDYIKASEQLLGLA